MNTRQVFSDNIDRIRQLQFSLWLSTARVPQIDTTVVSQNDALLDNMVNFRPKNNLAAIQSPHS